ncbi:MAG: hypothetical protein M3O50_07355 [Myxococcota bacterium]|nr:hypothetical protein [Myxococcota bacterium]
MSRSPARFPHPCGRGEVFILLLLFARTAQGADTKPEPIADDLKRACVAQHEAGQLLRRAGKLSEARAAMHACAQETCPAAVSADCASWMDAVTAAIPSVVISARMGGQTEENVSVTVDGRLLASRLDGRPIELDPGLHTFRFDTPAQVSIEQQVTLAEGEKNRPVNLTLAQPEPVRRDAVPDTYRPVPTLAYVMGGVAVVGLGVFAGFGLSGLNERTSLQSSCSPSCSNSQISSVRSKFVVADAGLAIAALSLAGGALAYATRPAVERKRLGQAAEAHALKVGFAPAPGGMVLGLQGIF